MQFFISFLEGIVTFISPCILPMLPIYISYFAGGSEVENMKKTFRNALGFCLGFTVVFVSLGALAGILGGFLREHQSTLNIVTGLIVIYFGLHFLGISKLSIFKGMKGTRFVKDLGFFSAMMFGMVFSIGWTPCVGAFLGSALMLASQQGEVMTGILMLLAYSLGLGIPFVVSAILIDKLKGTFDAIKRHYDLINKVCGGILVVVGILMMSGLLVRIVYLLG